jgi:hypothetical protein
MSLASNTSTNDIVPSYTPTPTSIIMPTQSPPSQQVTPTVKPTPIIQAVVTYKEIYQNMNNDYTDIVLLVSIQCNSEITLRYEQFALNIYTSRGGLTPIDAQVLVGGAVPSETGIVSDIVSFHMKFRFLSIYDSKYYSSYSLTYNNFPVEVSWVKQ